MTLAINVRARAGPGAGCSGARPKRLGARMAGHRSRRKREAHTSRGPSASEPRALHASRQPENTVPSSAGNQLGKKSQWSDGEGMGMDDQSPKVRDQESPAFWVSRLETLVIMMLGVRVYGIVIVVTTSGVSNLGVGGIGSLGDGGHELGT